MQLRSPIAVLSALSAALTTGRSAPFEDTKQLLAASESAATILNASISQTPNLNTSEMLQAIGYQIGASTANLNASNAEQGREPASDPAMDDVYFDYASTLVTLSEVVIRRGDSPHDEPNWPVYFTLNSLATAVHIYGLRLGSLDLISRRSMIRTITAGSAITRAQSAWSANITFPGW
ncbi:hypothetical protein KC360_g5080 [Hortaea werneckii]|nr:hypothetical protein KC361_g5356 [Hortaea werneckii]KAI6883346.1 hypothetical protein KC325_g5119 [Hortaea werneckii]KAI6992230.1 hypothetical protein KC359_g5806 [Hortaea werneckii]KAI7144853.1 hypothetical protein KC344_g5010 [Hortaea werneckii]KAI7173158.1 hypothetical protein KC360_g5080 [Hortaea werneckii]